jgi:formate-dependent nitrite reductase membrane component NrfD
MFRVFKVTSPMSVGSWILGVSGGASNTAAVLDLLGRMKRVRRAAETVSFASGPALATYTAALLANTAVPVWHDARRELPFVFAGSAAASSGAATALFLRPDDAGPARRLAVAGALLEGGAMVLMERRLGFVGEVYRQGKAGRLARIAKGCTAAGAVLLARGGRRSRLGLVAGSALVLGGELALRFSVFEAGTQSASDPRYTVEPQRERAAQRR